METETCTTSTASTDQQNGGFQKKFIKEEEAEDEDYLYCEECSCFFFNKCEVHGPALFIPDSPVPIGVSDRARQSLPPGLEVRESGIPDAGLGVFNNGDPVPVGAHFGPYQGELVDREEAMNSAYSWVIYKSSGCEEYIDAKREIDANWMRYVNCARTDEEQNLVVFQYRGGIYYRCCRPINPGQELLLWFDQGYCKKGSAFDQIWDKKCSTNEELRSTPKSTLQTQQNTDTREKPYASLQSEMRCTQRYSLRPHRRIELNLDFSESGSESDSGSDSSGDSHEEANGSTVWVEQTDSDPQRTAQEGDVMREAPGPTRYAKDNITSPLSSLMCLIDAEMWETIQKYSQAEGDPKNADKFKLTAEELKAFVGLLYLRGITGGKRMKLDDYWSADLGNPIFLQTMPRKKFQDIMHYLCFDDKSTRAARLVTDKFAMISEIFDKFVKNSIASYTPSENITVGEQLFPTKARCSFTQYMVNKPDKFGIKFYVAADVQTKYVLNTIPYLGKDNSRPADRRLSDNIVTCLLEPFLGKGRTITTDNFFPSITLANNLLANKTTVVGLMAKNRRGMPRCTQKQSERFSTKVLRVGNVTLTIYQAKPKKNVCILSTKHRTVSIDNGPKKMPETVSHYNSTKIAVDVMDQMARLYSVKGGSRRWSVAVFYNILDLAAINAHILYKQCMKVNIIRRKFILALVKELCAPQILAKRKEAIARRRLLPEALCPPAKRRQCQVGRCSGNKTFDVCQSCRRLVCGKCSKNVAKVCMDC